MEKRPFKLDFIMIIYLIGAIGLICIVLVIWTTDIAENLINNLFFFKGGIDIGDTIVPINLVIWAINYFFGPLFLITGIVTLPSVYGIYHLKSWTWEYILLISMFWTLFIFGLVVVWVFLKEDVKQLF
ncbi:MAG: hypothetical protein ACTSRG_04900 [Candidatus Helarchaeota archaeon]